jgi:hypothetical protein
MLIIEHVLLLYQHNIHDIVHVPLLPGMHSVILEPIGNESCGMLDVEHWTTAPDIEALAVATAVLDRLVRLVRGPSISVIF